MWYIDYEEVENIKTDIKEDWKVFGRAYIIVVVVIFTLWVSFLWKRIYSTETIADDRQYWQVIDKSNYTGYTEQEIEIFIRLEKENCINEKNELINRIKEKVKQEHWSTYRMIDTKNKFLVDKLKENAKDYEILWPEVINTIESIER